MFNLYKQLGNYFYFVFVLYVPCLSFTASQFYLLHLTSPEKACLSLGNLGISLEWQGGVGGMT